MTMLCAAYGQSEVQCFTGGADGKVYHWNKNSLVTTVEAHQGPVFVVQAAEKVCVFVCVTVCLTFYQGLGVVIGLIEIFVLRMVNYCFFIVTVTQ